ADEYRALIRQRRTRADLRLEECLTEVLAHAHHFSRGAHLRTERRIYAREFVEGKYRRFDEVLRHRQHTRRAASSQLPEIRKLAAEHQSHRDLRQRHTRGLAHV